MTSEKLARDNGLPALRVRGQIAFRRVQAASGLGAVTGRRWARSLPAFPT